MKDEVLSLMLQAGNLMLPNVGYLKQYVFFIAYELNFIAIGYRRDLWISNNYHFTKYFIKLGAVVCVCLRSGKREVNLNYFSFPIWTFRIKRKRKDAMSVSSCNSVNSATMHNTEIMIKMSFVITLIWRAIMIIVLNYFQMPF